MLIRSAKLFGAAICVMGCMQLAVAQCKKAKDEDIPHGANETILVDEGVIRQVHGMVFFPNNALESRREPQNDIVVEIYIYSGDYSDQNINKILGVKNRVAACVTGVDGRISFLRLKPGRYLLRAGTRERNQFNILHVILKLDPKRGDNKELEIVLQPCT
jgi:hypothetical protein